MSSIQTVMLVALGFLIAALLLLAIGPFYRRRTIRLATETLKRQLPVTEAEIKADKDRIRAEYAVRIHKLEQRVDEAAHAAARQKIELNRRDAAVSALEGEVARLGTSLEEHENARRVLEQTITERLPKVEYRLAEARKLLFQRDREIAQLTQSAEKHNRALEEATQINTQQRDEIHRLGAALTTRAARNREGLGDPRFDGEVALRSEIEALRDKSRDQAAMIARLQSLLVRAGSAAEGLAGLGAGAQSRTAADIAVAAGTASSDEVQRLSQALAEAQAALKAAQSGSPGGDGARSTAAAEAEIRALKAALDDKSTEVATLTASLKAYETPEEMGGLKDSKIAMKARLASLQAQTSEQAGLIQSLRAEIANSNERLARQAQHFRDEMRRLGAGTVPTSSEPRATSEAAHRRSLAERIADPRVRASAPPVAEPARVSGFLKAIEGNAGQPNGGDHAPAESAEPAAAAPSATEGEQKPRRARLLERITGLDKPHA